jgi:hypothetical protein
MIINPKYKEIFEAWLISFNPTDAQLVIAQERLDVCMGCEYKKELIKKNKWSAYCEKCGCPLNKKIFSNMFNPCPAKKWIDIDSKYLKSLKPKEKKSII